MIISMIMREGQVRRAVKKDLPYVRILCLAYVDFLVNSEFLLKDNFVKDIPIYMQ